MYSCIGMHAMPTYPPTYLYLHTHTFVILTYMRCAFIMHRWLPFVHFDHNIHATKCAGCCQPAFTNDGLETNDPGIKLRVNMFTS